MKTSSRFDGTRLRSARKNAGLSQAELGIRAGVEQPHISALEGGARTPSMETLRLLAGTLGVSVHWLCGEDATHRLLPARMRPEHLIEDENVSAGLIALAGDARLIESLQIQPEEWGVLRSLKCPTLTKEGYLAVLLVLRGHS
ncbi:helix-turn-helix transcriptional regulator [Thiohalocapsa sp.]|jgi:transcriptional regulator with XRE-family HTH domain|uniref:helix-turn-helix domain-containing protein n=1 Tax=Thiohalocapsa sp. TaxID=2497641 RepID=UPI0025DDEB81|nr:helix-turn-helix transcriptional regulator [Thiohalocapsa sp.]